MHELTEVTYERYREVMGESKRKEAVYLLSLSANQIWVLHQTLRLAITHLDVYVMKTILKEDQKIIEFLCGHLRNMGFTDEEVLYFDSAFTKERNEE